MEGIMRAREEDERKESENERRGSDRIRGESGLRFEEEEGRGRRESEVAEWRPP